MAKESWRTDWPATKSPKAWMVAVGEKALAIKDPEERIEKVCFAIDRLLAYGFRADANKMFKRLERELEQHPQVIDDVRWTLAPVLIAIGKPQRAEELYLRAIEQTKQDKKLKSKKRQERLAWLRREALDEGLLDLFDDLTDEERAGPQFKRCIREADEALARGDKRAALAAARKAEAIAAADPDEQASRSNRLLRLYADAGEKNAALRMLNAMDQSDRKALLVGKLLVKVGLKRKAVEMARQDIKRELDEARQMDLPNYHFTAHNIASTISFLIDEGEEAEARRLVEQVGKEMSAWETHRAGWVEAAVYSDLAVPVARLHGRRAAERMLEVAADAAKADRTAFRSGAWSAIVEVYAQIGAWDEALAVAKRHSRGESGRADYACLLAKAGRWKELREVLSKVKTPLEASDAAWWVAISLAGPPTKRR
jgi:hypothetical protein